MKPQQVQVQRDLAAAVFALARLARVLERACQDLTLGQYRVLAMIAGGGERASGLAERLALGKPAVSAAVSGLEARGLIRRTEVRADRRAAALEITPKGTAALERAQSAMAARLDDLCDLTDRRSTLAAVNSLGTAIDRQRSRRRAERRSKADSRKAVAAGTR